MSYRILVIEDNAANMELVTDLLEAAGFSVYPAASGEQGLRAAEAIAPDLVLMDLSLPGLDGLATTRALRKHPATSHLPIVALTAHAMKGDQEVALRAGCNGYLTKPIDTRTFVSSVSAFLMTDANEPQPS
jgi:two-component system, cell cycle response regulator DivK